MSDKPEALYVVDDIDKLVARVIRAERERDETLLKWSTLSHQMDAEVAKHTDTLQALDDARASAEYWQAEAERFRLEARDDARAAGAAQAEVERLQAEVERLQKSRSYWKRYGLAPS